MVGSIVRINPHEVHIRDPDYYETIYSTTRLGIDKPGYAKYPFSAPGAIVSTPEHELHRQRKTVLNPFFSKRAVLKQAHAIQCQVDKISSRLATEYAPSGKVLALGDLFSSYTADVVTKYAFDQTYNFLDAPDFLIPFTKSIEGFKKFAHHATQFPLLPRVLARLPDRILMTLQPGMLAALEYKRVWLNAYRRA
jgi:cytochrome P450